MLMPARLRQISCITLFYVILLFSNVCKTKSWLLSPVNQYLHPKIIGQDVLMKYLPKDPWSKMCYNLFKPHVSYREQGALINITFVIEGPGPIGLVGPSGSGKSTFMKLLSGEEKIINGTFKITPSINHPTIYVDKWMPIELSAQVDHTLRDALGPKLIAETDAFDRIIDCTDLRREKNTVVRNLSGGAKFRYKLALALAQAAYQSLECPPILLVDELLDREDLRIRTPVNQLLRTLADDMGVTVVLASHDMLDIRIACKDVVTFYNGKIESIGAPNDSKHVQSKFEEVLQKELKVKYGIQNPYKFHFNPADPITITKNKKKKDKGLRYIHLPSYESSFTPPEDKVPFL